MNDELYDNNARDTMVIDIQVKYHAYNNNLYIYICCIIDHSTVQWLHMYVYCVHPVYCGLLQERVNLNFEHVWVNCKFLKTLRLPGLDSGSFLVLVEPHRWFEPI